MSVKTQLKTSIFGHLLKTLNELPLLATFRAKCSQDPCCEVRVTSRHADRRTKNRDICKGLGLPLVICKD